MVETGSPTAKILRISPEITDLLPNKQLKCPESDCSSIFSNSANLQMHVERHHYRRDSIKPKTDAGSEDNGMGIPDNNSLTKWYFCPVNGCSYFDTGKDSNKHFVCLKYVRQHYQKVHAAKLFQCEKCGKTFTTEGMRLRHEINCGRVYKCDECGWGYKSRETLLTHARRKKHTIDWEKTKNSAASTKRPPSNDTVIIGTQTTTPIQILVKLSTQTQDQGIQTDPVEIKEQQKKRRATSSSKSGARTSKKLKHISTETQSQSSVIASIKTELTNSPPPENNLNRLNYVEDGDVEDSFTSSLEQLVNSTGGLCDIETQTEKFSSTILDQMLYSHMHTQTCDEFLSELGLADIQTQTNLSNGKDVDDATELGGDEPSSGRNVFGAPHDEMLVSTETQTSFTQCLLEYNEAGTSSNGITQHTQTCDTLLEGLFGGQENDLIGNFQSAYTQT